MTLSIYMFLGTLLPLFVQGPRIKPRLGTLNIFNDSKAHAGGLFYYTLTSIKANLAPGTVHVQPRFEQHPKFKQAYLTI